jgi:cyclopropane-fatty-acyl-phospholipid synthase
LPAAFFDLWLGANRHYSCARWGDDAQRRTLDLAQQAKVDFYLGASQGQPSRILDVGCGWGAALHELLDRLPEAKGIGLTVTQAHADAVEAPSPRVTGLCTDWRDFEPTEPFDLILNFEALEHFEAEDEAAPGSQYAAYFRTCSEWLESGSPMWLQVICAAGENRPVAADGPLNTFIYETIFPNSSLPNMASVLASSEPYFRVDVMEDGTADYSRTLRAWHRNLRDRIDAATEIVGSEVASSFLLYLAACEVVFRRRDVELYRIVFRRRDSPLLVAFEDPASKPIDDDRWRGSAGLTTVDGGQLGASVEALEQHYGLGAPFFSLWLDPNLVYSAGHWGDAVPDPAGAELDRAQRRKLDFYGARMPEGARVLDIGCGWGGTLARLLDEWSATAADGITLSPDHEAYCRRRFAGDDRATVTLAGWDDFETEARYDAIISLEAIEHFAQDMSSRRQRHDIYEAFFERAHGWLEGRGVLCLQSSCIEGADKVGGGPIANLIRGEIYPESLPPYLSELLITAAPYFSFEHVWCSPAGHAKTLRAWHLGLRRSRAEIEERWGADAYRRYVQYVSACEHLFRTGEWTVSFMVLRRRPVVAKSTRSGVA